MDIIDTIKKWMKTSSGAFIISLITIGIATQLCKDYTQLIPALYWALLYKYLREDL